MSHVSHLPSVASQCLPVAHPLDSGILGLQVEIDYVSAHASPGRAQTPLHGLHVVATYNVTFLDLYSLSTLCSTRTSIPTASSAWSSSSLAASMYRPAAAK